MAIRVRQAVLDDVIAINRLYLERISVWQRLTKEGLVENVPYEQLSLYERWLHGGAWMSIETGSIYLNHLLLGAGIPYVAVLPENGHDRVVGYAEAYINNEPEPFGMHLHLAHIVLEQASTTLAIASANALLDAVIQRGAQLKCQRVTINQIDTDPAWEAARHRFETTPLPTVRRYSVSARTGQGFYRASDLADTNAMQVSGWAMPIGRLTSSRHQWETLMPRIWDTLPEIRAQRIHRIKFAAGTIEAFIVCRQRMHDPRSADISGWMPKLLPPQMVIALRDWAHREGYRTLWFDVLEDQASALGPDAEADVLTLQTSALTLTG